MTSVNFAYFLQGYLELSEPEIITLEILERIKGHSRLAFRDDIDPSMGDENHQTQLNNINMNYLSNLQPGDRC